MQEEQFERHVEDLRSSLENKDKERFHDSIEGIHPIDIAHMLEEIDNEQLVTFYEFTDNEFRSQIMAESNEELQIRMVTLFDFNDIAQMFSYMSNDDVTDVLGVLPIQTRKNVLDQMRGGEVKELQVLLGYAEDSAGGLMTTEYIALKSELPIKRALEKIKEIGPRTEVIETIYVLNRNKELIGTADLRDILNAEDQELLKNIMDDNVISVNPEVDQETVAQQVSRYNMKSIPVVNHSNLLLGVITVDDIIDVIVQEMTEDILNFGGVSGDDRAKNSFRTSVKQRLPWLFVNLATAFLASFTVGLFEDTIAQVVALAAAMPIVAGLGGNAGTQTLSVTIRSITLGEINLKRNWKMVFKEAAVGVFNGAVIGAITGVILFLRYGNPYLGLIIFAAMVGNLVIAGCFGFLVPLILKSLKIDPALASSIFLTTATDVVGFFLFLGLAQTFLPLLV